MKINSSHVFQYACTLILIVVFALYQYRDVDPTLHEMYVTKNQSNWNRTELLQDGIMARAYTWNKALPCYPPDEPMKEKNGYRKAARNGILFVKLIKVGGSTATGVTMNIAKHEAERRHEKFGYVVADGIIAGRMQCCKIESGASRLHGPLFATRQNESLANFSILKFRGIMFHRRIRRSWIS